MSAGLVGGCSVLVWSTLRFWVCLGASWLMNSTATFKDSASPTNNTVSNAQTCEVLSAPLPAPDANRKFGQYVR